VPPLFLRYQQPFPADYNQAVRQAQASVTAALADGANLVEVEFPTTSLIAVAGDGEGRFQPGGGCHKSPPSSIAA
jgi:hypothetical protein